MFFEINEVPKSTSTINFNEARVLNNILPTRFDWVRSTEDNTPIKYYKKNEDGSQGEFKGLKLRFTFLECDKEGNVREWQGRKITQNLDLMVNQNESTLKRFLDELNGLYHLLTGQAPFIKQNINKEAVDGKLSNEAKMMEIFKNFEVMNNGELEQFVNDINDIFDRAKVNKGVDFQMGNMFCHFNWNGKYLTPYSESATNITNEKQWSTNLLFPFTYEPLEFTKVEVENELTNEKETKFHLTFNNKIKWELKRVNLTKQVSVTGVSDELASATTDLLDSL